MLNKQKHHKTTVLRRRWISLVLPLLAVLLSFTAAMPAYAASTASFSLATSGSTTVGGTFTVTVSINQSTGVSYNTVQLGVTYPTSNLTFVSASPVAPFGVSAAAGGLGCLGAPTGGGGTVSMLCSAAGGVTGTNQFATLTFTVNGAGSGTVQVQSSSSIYDSGSNIWDGTLSSASATFSAAPTSTSGGGSKSTGTGSSSGSTGSSSKSTTPSSGTTAKPSTSATSTPTTSQPTVTIPSTPAVTPPASAAFTITVTDSSGKPVNNAKVVVDSQYSEYTNTRGQAGFSGLAIGAHTVTVTAPGKSASVEKLTLSANNNKQVALKLASSTTPLLLVVYALAGLIILGGGGFGYVKLSHRGLKPPQFPTSGIVVGSADQPAVEVNNALTPEIMPISPVVPATPVAPIVPSPALQEAVVVQPSVTVISPESAPASSLPEAETTGLPHQPAGTP